MLKKLSDTLRKLTRESVRTDPSKFNDSIAMQTRWTPQKGGGASFKTHRLVNVSAYRIEFRSSAGAKIFYSIFLLSGLGIMFIFLKDPVSNGSFAIELDILFPMLIGLLFALVGGFLFFRGSVPIVFDKSNGYFLRGRKNPSRVYDQTKIKSLISLQNIHALQIISEHISSNKSSYYSYEINLVLKDASRVNVIDHGNLDRIREDAKTLSDFLGKPVWDATL